MATEISLTEGCQLAKLSYNVLLRRVLIGAVRGERREGRWYVSRVDIDRLAAAGSTAKRKQPA